MNLFAIVAGMVVVIHLVAVWQRPRLALIVSGILWLLYAYYEHLVATGILCDSDCNIRVDLVFFFPILWVAASCAYRSYLGRPGQMLVLGTVLGVVGLLVSAFVLGNRGDAALSGVAVTAALAIVVYAVVSRFRTRALRQPP